MTKKLILGHLKTNLSPNRRNELLRMFNTKPTRTLTDNIIN